MREATSFQDAAEMAQNDTSSIREAIKQINAEADAAKAELDSPKWDGLSYMLEDGTVVEWDNVWTGLMTYSTMGLRVDDFKAFTPQDRPPFYVFAGHIINSLEHFAADYRQNIGAICAESAKLLARKQDNPNALHPQAGMQLMGIVQGRLEKFFDKLNSYNGKESFEIAMTMPYSVVRYGGDGRREDQVNLDVSMPYVNGMTFVAKWTAEPPVKCCGKGGDGGVGGGT